MGMGFSGNHADVVQPEMVARLCLDEYTALYALLQSHELDWDEFGVAVKYDGQEHELLVDALAEWAAPDLELGPFADAILAAYRRLQAAFARATTVRIETDRDIRTSCLELFAGHHDQEDDGDRYDEVSGLFWAVDGMRQLSPAGEKFESEITSVNFVTFG